MEMTEQQCELELALVYGRRFPEWFYVRRGEPGTLGGVMKQAVVEGRELVRKVLHP